MEGAFKVGVIDSPPADPLADSFPYRKGPFAKVVWKLLIPCSHPNRVPSYSQVMRKIVYICERSELSPEINPGTEPQSVGHK